MAYEAYVVKLHVSPHPNADRLQVAHINGTQVVIGLDLKTDDLAVYFPSDGQLSEAYANANDLIARVDANGVKAGGYFDHKRRVKAQNFRKVKSDGFIMPLSSLAFTGYDISKLKAGDSFTKLNDVEICNKYYTQATLNAMKNGKAKTSLKHLVAMPEHYDTTQFRFAVIEEGSVIYFSEKEHGTSFRYGNVMVKTPITNPIKKFWNKLRKGDGFTEQREYVLGTRRAILPFNKETQTYGGGFYGNGDPYTLAHQMLHKKLKDDEIVYGELIGFLATGASMFSQGTNGLPDVKKRYGENMVFSYGCPEGTAKLRVYRITQNGRELTQNELIARCRELGVDTCYQMGAEIYDGDRDRLNAKVESILEGPSHLDDRHIREGICLRVENPNGIRIFKAKSWTFGVLEGYIKDNETYIDLEEVS